jgi:hypothetical protein
VSPQADTDRASGTSKRLKNLVFIVNLGGLRIALTFRDLRKKVKKIL